MGGPWLLHWILASWILAIGNGCQVIINDLEKNIHYVSVHEKCLNIVVDETVSSDVARTVCQRKAGRLARMEHMTEERIHAYIQQHVSLEDWGYWIGPSDAVTFDSLLYIPKMSDDKNSQTRYLVREGSKWRSLVKQEIYSDDQEELLDRRKKDLDDMFEDQEEIDDRFDDDDIGVGERIVAEAKYKKLTTQLNETGLAVSKYHRVPDRIGFICEYYLMQNRTTPRADHDSTVKRFIMAYVLFIVLVLTQTGLTVCFVNARNNQSLCDKTDDKQLPYETVKGTNTKGIEATD